MAKYFYNANDTCMSRKLKEVFFSHNIHFFVQKFYKRKTLVIYIWTKFWKHKFLNIELIKWFKILVLQRKIRLIVKLFLVSSMTNCTSSQCSKFWGLLWILFIEFIIQWTNNLHCPLNLHKLLLESMNYCWNWMFLMNIELK